MKRAIVALTAVVVVAQLWGCGVVRRAAVMSDASESNSIAMARFSTKDLDPIRGKASFPGSGLKSPTSAPNECPTEQEKIAINRLREIMIDNKNDLESLVSKHNFKDGRPPILGLEALIYNAGKLYRCEMTYQQYAEERERINSLVKDAMMNIAQADAYEKRIRAQQTAAAFGAALQNAGVAIQQQEAIRQANRPRQTICRQIGDSVKCTTY